MSEVAHVDGNALGGLLIEVFGREMTGRLGCCASCGSVSPLGALIVYRGGPGDVFRCPACGAVILVAVVRGETVRVGFESLRWLEVTD